MLSVRGCVRVLPAAARSRSGRCDCALSRERDPVHQILHESERAEPAADKTAEQAAEYEQKTERGKGHRKTALV